MTATSATPEAATFAEAVAAAIQVEQEAREREGAALAVLADAEAVFQVALAEAGLTPDGDTERKALEAARRVYDRADAAAALAEAGVKEATRRREAAEAEERIAEVKAARWQAYLESCALLERGAALVGEFADYIASTTAALDAWDEQFRALEAEGSLLRARGGTAPRWDPPSTLRPVWASIKADLARLANVYVKQENRP